VTMFEYMALQRQNRELRYIFRLLCTLSGITGLHENEFFPLTSPLDTRNVALLAVQKTRRARMANTVLKSWPLQGARPTSLQPLRRLHPRANAAGRITGMAPGGVQFQQSNGTERFGRSFPCGPTHTEPFSPSLAARRGAIRRKGPGHLGSDRTQLATALAPNWPGASVAPSSAMM